MEPDQAVTNQLEARLDAAISADQLGKVADLSDEDLSAAVIALNELEDSVSQSRRDLHGAIDTLQGEVTRRYRTGEASVDGLLKS